MTPIRILPLIALSSALAGAPLLEAEANSPTKAYCEANFVAATHAADEAISSSHDLRKAGAGLVAGGTCTVLLVGFGGLDLGLTGLGCAVLSTWIVSTMPAPESGQAAADAFTAVRDPRCVDLH